MSAMILPIGGIGKVLDVGYVSYKLLPKPPSIKILFVNKILSRYEEGSFLELFSLNYTGTFLKYLGTVKVYLIKGYTWLDSISGSVLGLYFLYTLNCTYIVSGMDNEIDLKNIIDCLNTY